MPRPAIDLATARVLISNDDGIEAEGLHLLERVVRPLVKEVWVVAPETEQSAASHSLTMRRPLYVRRARGRRRYTVDGTPTDCVLLAINRVLEDRPPDLVLSGVNRGGNLGEDATYSGTIAAAMEGTLLGVPSIAFSQRYSDGRLVPWGTAAAWIRPTLERLVAVGWPSNVLMNVNFPDLPADKVSGVEVTRLGRHKVGGAMNEGVDPRGEGYFWIGGRRDEDHRREGTDLEAVCRGAVSVTPLCLDLTHRPTVRRLRRMLA